MTTKRHDPVTQKVLDEHRVLSADLNDLERVLGATPGLAARRRWLDELATRLVRLEPRLREHFAHEERSGLFRQLQDAWPNASPVCRELLAEHGKILERLGALAARVSAAPADDPAEVARLSGAIQGILDVLRHHEDRENALLQGALEGGPSGLD